MTDVDTHIVRIGCCMAYSRSHRLHLRKQGASTKKEGNVKSCTHLKRNKAVCLLLLYKYISSRLAGRWPPSVTAISIYIARKPKARSSADHFNTKGKSSKCRSVVAYRPAAARSFSFLFSLCFLPYRLLPGAANIPDRVGRSVAGGRKRSLALPLSLLIYITTQDLSLLNQRASQLLDSHLLTPNQVIYIQQQIYNVRNVIWSTKSK